MMVIPKIGQYQWRIDRRIGGYTATKEEAVNVAVAKCLEDAAYYDYPRPWFVGVVIRVNTTRVEHGWQGKPSRRTAVVTSTVAFGHGVHTDELINVPSGAAQGRAR